MIELEKLQEDLKNERMHCLFYQQAAAIVTGPHREEFRELFLKEAQSELNHIDEFATLIVQLGGIPNTNVNQLPEMTSCPIQLCKAAARIEKIVATNYAERLEQIDADNRLGTECSEDECIATSKYMQLFYEDQLQDSRKAAFEFSLLSK